MLVNIPLPWSRYEQIGPNVFIFDRNSILLRMEKCTIQQAIYLGILFKASRGPNVSGHFDPDRHGLLSRANGELVGRRQRRPTLPS